MKPGWLENLSEIEKLIQNALIPQAQEKLKTIRLASVARSHTAKLGRLSWRAGLPYLGLRLLNPIVSSEKSDVLEPKPDEICEYAMCLMRVGAVEEAERLLSQPTAASYPFCELYRSFALVSVWDYAGAMAPLQRAIANTQLDAYNRVVARVNLAASMVYESRFALAQAELRDLIAIAEKNRYSLLLGTCMEWLANCLISEGNWKEAEYFLEQSLTHFAGGGEAATLYLRKWQAVKLLKQTGNTKEAIQALHAVRDSAKSLQHWETVRDCDKYEAIHGENEPLFWKVYFGTPFTAYRERLATLSHYPASIPSSFDWHLRPDGQSSSRSAAVVRTHDLNLSSEAATLRGSLLHSLFLALTSDFYRPCRVATLHHRIAPNETFNPISKPNKIHQLVFRLRHHLKAAAVGLEIGKLGDIYRLTSHKGVTVVVDPDRKLTAKRDTEWDRVQKAYPDRSFKVPDLVALLQLPERTCQRLLESWVQSGMVAREGKARATKYRVSPAQPLRKAG